MSAGGRGGVVPGGSMAGGGNVNLREIAYMLDDLQYMSTMGIRPIVNNLMMVHPVLGMLAMGVDQVIRNWKILNQIWTGENATQTEAERMKELAKQTNQTVDEMRELSRYEQERSEGKRLVTAPTEEQKQQITVTKGVFEGQDIGNLVQRIAEARGPQYDEAQKEEFARFEALNKSMEGPTDIETAWRTFRLSIDSISSGYKDIGQYIEDRRQELYQRGRGVTEENVRREFARAEADPRTRAKLIEELNKLGIGEKVQKGLENVQAGTAISPEEMSKMVGEFVRDQSRYADEAEKDSEKIERLREASEQYRQRIQMINDMLGRSEVSTEAAERAQEALAHAMDQASYKADSLTRAHERLVKKMEEEDLAALTEEQAREKRTKQEQTYDTAAQAYRNVMGGSMAQAMVMARARGEDAEAVDIRLRGQLERRMQAIPEELRGEVSRRVVEQVREQATGMAAQQGALRDAQRAALQAQFAPVGTDLGFAQRQALARAERESGMTPEGRMRLADRGTMLGAMQRQALAVQKPVMQDQAVANDLAKRMEGAAGRMEAAAEKMASGDIRVKF